MSSPLRASTPRSLLLPLLLPLLPLLSPVLAGCPPKEKLGNEKAEVCDAPNPSSAWDGAPVFTEVTGEWGLSGMVGGRFAAADVNGDGYPDLIATDLFANVRDAPEAGDFKRRLLLNDGGAGFTDFTLESGISMNREGTQGTSRSLHVMGDVDNDGDLDIFAGHNWDAGDANPPQDMSEILLNDGSGRFTFATASDPAHVEGYPTTSAAFTDWDGDGRLDLWVVGWYLQYGYYTAVQSHLYQGGGDGSFDDVTEGVGLELPSNIREDLYEHYARRPAFGATACDLNGDARPELIQTNYGRSWNHLWQNNGDSFEEISEAAGFDDDGNDDYTDNLMYACYCETHACSPAPTISCGGSFPDNYWAVGVDDQPFRLNGNSFTTVCADIDNDGDNDLYTAEIRHLWAGQSADHTQLLLNNINNDGGADITFTRVDNEENGLAREHPRQGDWNEGDLYAAFFDFDNDGWKDILLVSSDYEDTRMWLWRQVEAGRFEEIGEAAGMDQPWPAGLAIADFDLDGDLDVVTGSSTARSGTPWTAREIHVYRNDSPKGNYVRIEGLPVGTRVEVEAGGLTQVQEVGGGYGHYSIQNDVPLHFGLGDVCQIDRITATFPGGRVGTWEDVAANRTVTLTP